MHQHTMCNINEITNTETLSLFEYYKTIKDVNQKTQTENIC